MNILVFAVIHLPGLLLPVLVALRGPPRRRPPPPPPPHGGLLDDEPAFCLVEVQLCSVAGGQVAVVALELERVGADLGVVLLLVKVGTGPGARRRRGFVSPRGTGTGCRRERGS